MLTYRKGRKACAVFSESIRENGAILFFGEEQDVDG